MMKAAHWSLATYKRMVLFASVATLSLSASAPAQSPAAGPPPPPPAGAIQSLGPPPEPAAETFIPYASTEDSVKLPDGRTLNFVCMGEGSPTVILTPAMGMMMARAWGGVQPQLAQTTRVCAWDRPGFGLSDGAAWKQTAEATTRDLETALASGTIPGPYVMVGHSLGGIESMLFADRNRDQVAGMVLVDTAIPDQQAVLKRAAPGMPDAADGPPDPLAQVIKTCAGDIRAGAARLGGPDPHGCFSYPPNWPEELRKAMAEHQDNTALLFENIASSVESSGESMTQAVNPSRNYGDMPLIVLTNTASPDRPGAPPEVQEAVIAMNEAWNAAHVELAALSTRGINARVPGADHMMHLSGKADVVIDAVEAVVREARDASR